MSVEFDEEKNFNSAYNQSVSSPASGLTSWFIKKGWVKDEKGAQYLMFFVIAICFGLTIFLIVK